MGEQEFELLLGRMPEIAASVNAFTSEVVQQRAFDALIRRLTPTSGDIEEIPTIGEAVEPELAQADQSKSERASSSTNGRVRRRKSSSKKDVADVRDLNFRPAGETPFRDFAVEKSPTTLEEKNIVAVYYLERVMKVEGITAGHVVAAYLECRWRTPGDPMNSLSVTASRRRWLNTTSSQDIKTTISGRNFVEHDMPTGK